VIKDEVVAGRTMALALNERELEILAVTARLLTSQLDVNGRIVSLAGLGCSRVASNRILLA